MSAASRVCSSPTACKAAITQAEGTTRGIEAVAAGGQGFSRGPTDPGEAEYVHLAPVGAKQPAFAEPLIPLARCAVDRSVGAEAEPLPSSITVALPTSDACPCEFGVGILAPSRQWDQHSGKAKRKGVGFQRSTRRDGSATQWWWDLEKAGREAPREGYDLDRLRGGERRDTTAAAATSRSRETSSLRPRGRAFGLS